MAALTPKQEAFCQSYIEQGNATEAYRQAYQSQANIKTQKKEAHRILHTPSVAARVAELRAAQEVIAQKVHGVTIASLLEELEEARQIGRENGQASAMIAATMGKAKLAGLDKDGDGDDTAQPVRVEVTVTDARVRDAEP